MQVLYYIKYNCGAFKKNSLENPIVFIIQRMENFLAHNGKLNNHETFLRVQCFCDKVKTQQSTLKN